MHLLIIPSERYLPADDPLAGIFQHDQASALLRAGERIGILSVELRALVLLKKKGRGWLSGQHVSVEDGIPVYRHHGWFWTPFWRRGYLHQYLQEGLRLFARYLDEQGAPDLIHAHNALRAGILAAEIKKHYGVPYIITEHSSDYSRGTIRQADVNWIRQAYAEADCRLVVSKNLGVILKSFFGETSGPFQVMPNMLDGIFTQIDALPGRNMENCFTFLNVGGLVAVKRQDLLIAAFARGFRGRKNVSLRIVGAGTCRGELEKLVQETGLTEQVTFAGQLDRVGVRDEMLRCDVYVHSSSSETFGVAIIEAMACGKPVVTTACGGPDELITESIGKLVQVDDAGALAREMDFVMTHVNSYDARKIRDFCLERFSEKAVAASLLALYGEVMQGKRRG